MSSLKDFINVVLLFAIVALGLQSSSGQKKGSEFMPIKWSPQNKEFAIEVPISLEKINDYDAEAYGGIKGNCAFQVVIVQQTEEEQKQNLEDKLGGLQFLVGGDDDRDFAEKYLKIDGLSAKEIVYKTQNNKGLMIDHGDKIYVLSFHGSTRRDLDSKVAHKFFTSFKLLRR